MKDDVLYVEGVGVVDMSGWDLTKLHKIINENCEHSSEECLCDIMLCGWKSGPKSTQVCCYNCTFICDFRCDKFHEISKRGFSDIRDLNGHTKMDDDLKALIKKRFDEKNREAV